MLRKCEGREKEKKERRKKKKVQYKVNGVQKIIKNK
jgi:hypothetical protein